MSKKHFIALADAIRAHNQGNSRHPFTEHQIKMLANFCSGQNYRFNCNRWLEYIAGECGPNGGKLKQEVAA